MATVTPPDKIEVRKPAAEVARAVSRDRGLTKLSRLQTLGVFFGILGFTLIFQVASALPADDITFVFGLGDGVPQISLDPPNLVLGIGILFLVAAAVALADRWTGRYAGVALVVCSILFVPLVLVCAVALSSTTQTNLLPLLSQSLRL